MPKDRSDTSDAARELILRRCHELGFARSGIASALPPEHGDAYVNWIEQGLHGEMAYMARHVDVRLDPQRLLDGTRSVICVADRYARPGRDRRTDQAAGRIARYARGEDYHRSMKKRLQTLADELRQANPDAEFRVCVDTAPVLEREFATRAGLGAVGKNTMLIAPGEGSYLLLGEVLTTLDLTSSRHVPKDPCASCTRCLDACPTQALTPWRMDATRCISYLTIEHRGHIDPALFAAMGDWIFGCDICQEVCPHNQPTRRSASLQVHATYASERNGFDLLNVLGWSEEDRRAAFTKSSMKRAKLDPMRRNAVIAAGNVLNAGRGDAHLRRRLAEIADDETEPELVRRTGAEVLARLDESAPDLGAAGGVSRNR